MHIQQKWYLTPILHNVTMNISPTYIIHGYNLIIGKKIKLGILDNKLSNLQNFSLYVLCNLPINPIKPMFFGEKSKLQKLTQRPEIFVINHCLTFIQQAENSCKLNKLSFVLHYLTIPLLEHNGCKKLTIKNLIFHMHTFWIHDPFTIKTFSFTCKFLNKIPLCNYNFLLPFNFGTNTTFHNRNRLNFIKNRFYLWHFYNPNLLKLTVYINHDLLRFFRSRAKFIINMNNNNL